MINMMPKDQGEREVHRIEIEPTVREVDGYKRFQEAVLSIQNYGQKDMFILLNGYEIPLRSPLGKGDVLDIKLTGLYLGPGYPRA